MNESHASRLDERVEVSKAVEVSTLLFPVSVVAPRQVFEVSLLNMVHSLRVILMDLFVD